MTPLACSHDRPGRGEAAGAGPHPDGLRPRPGAGRHRGLRPRSSPSSRTQFPLLHERLELTRIGTHGLLFRWRRRAATERPVVLMAHLDVVPVDESAPWQHPPFSAEIVDGAVWGRGTLDDKGCVAAICEAVERLLERRPPPAQDVWLSFGCDEEVSGPTAAAAVDELVRRGVRPWFVLDEGGAVAARGVPGREARRSRVDRRRREGHHQRRAARRGPRRPRLDPGPERPDRPPGPGDPRGSTARRCRRSCPDATVELMRRLAPHAPAAAAPGARPAPTGSARCSPGRCSPPAPRPRRWRARRSRSPRSRARPALNVIASPATAGVNIRVHAGRHRRRRARPPRAGRSTTTDVADRRRRARRGQPGLPDRTTRSTCSSPTIGELFPDAVPAPYVMTAPPTPATSPAICERVYRFAPFRMTKAQRQAIHSYDEHLGVDDFLAGVELVPAPDRAAAPR